MIDIHSHILPGLDDGSETIEDSIEMLRMAAASGTTDIVATPHANMEFEFDPAEVEGKIAALQAAAGAAPRIHYGCDFHLTPENIESALREPGKYSINHRGYLLVEFADSFIPKSTGDIFSTMLDAGIRPIITHPERNRLLQKMTEELESWVEMGCLVQVTAQSLLGFFGNRAKESSHDLMARRLVHFLASDAHDVEHRTTELRPAWEYVGEHFGADTARLLLQDNPRAVLDGTPIRPGGLTRRKNWWSSLFPRRTGSRKADAAVATRC